MKFRYLFLKSKLTWSDWGQADSFFYKVFYCKVTAVYIQYTVKVFALNTDVCFTEKKYGHLCKYLPLSNSFFPSAILFCSMISEHISLQNVNTSKFSVRV